MKNLSDFAQANKPLIEQLKIDEGFRSGIYLDSEGYKTIGYGTLLEHGLSTDEAELLLVSRAYEAAKELARAKPIVREVSNNRYFALCNFVYNVGLSRLLGFKRMWAAIEADDWELAAREALDSKWATQVGKRADRIAELMREG